MRHGLRRVEQGKESSVAFALHVGFGNEAERGTVDAIAQSAGGFRAVVEDVAEVGAAEFAAHLRALHAVAVVGEVVEQVRIDGLREGRPAATRFKLVGREEKGFAGRDVDIDARAELLVVGIFVRGFSGRFLRHGILEVVESAAQFRVGGFLVSALLRCVGVRLAGFLKEGGRHMAIAAGMHIEIVLVIVLGGIEVTERFDLDGHGAADGSGEFRFLGHEHRAECGIGVVDAGAVLRPHVTALTVHAGRVDGAEEELHEERERKALRVVFHFDGLGKTGVVAAHLFVGGVFRMAIGIAHTGVEHPVDLFEEMLGAPEAASGKVESGSIVHCGWCLGVALCACARGEGKPEGQPQRSDRNKQLVMNAHNLYCFELKMSSGCFGGGWQNSPCAFEKRCIGEFCACSRCRNSAARIKK